MIALRPFEPADAPEVAALLRSYKWEERYVRGQLLAIAALAGDPECGLVRVALAGESIHGFVAVELHEWNGLAQIHGLAVRESYLRRGIGTRLIEEAERFVRTAHFRGIYVDTPVTNARGRAFYRKCGYIEDYAMTRYYSDDLDGVTLVKFFGNGSD